MLVIDPTEFEKTWNDCIQLDTGKDISSDFQSILTTLYVWIDGTVSNTLCNNVADLAYSTCPSVREVTYNSTPQDVYNEAQLSLTFRYNDYRRKQNAS